MIGILAALAIFLAACGTTPPPSGGDTFALEVTTDGTGTGTVTATVDGEPVADMNAIEADAEVTLTAVAGADSEFTGWAGACAGTDATCVVTMDADKAVTATFDEVTEPLPTEVPLTVEFAADSLDGTVSQAELGINCSVDGADSDCSAPAVSTSEATTFTATPGGPDIGIEWVGLSCANGATECAVTPDSDPYVLTVRFYDTSEPETITREVPITDGEDDGLEWISPRQPPIANHGEGDTHNSLAYMGLGYTARWEAETAGGFIFRDLGIPAGSIITEAYIQFTSIEATSGSCPTAGCMNAGDSAPANLIVHAVADTAPTAIPNQNDTDPILTRAQTTASVEWVVPEWTVKGASGAEQATPDLTALLQEVIDLGTWGPDSDDVMFVIQNNDADATVGYRQIATFEEGGDSIPTLHFTYTPPAP